MTDDKTEKEKQEHGIMPFWQSGFGNFDSVFDNFRKDFEQAFMNPFGAGFSSHPRNWGSSIACDLADEGDKFVVTTAMPGMKKDEINIDVGSDHITISAEHKESQEEKEKKYIRKEQRSASFSRRLSLPENVKSSDVKATLNDGVLTISLPKEQPTPEPKTTKVDIE